VKPLWVISCCLLLPVFGCSGLDRPEIGHQQPQHALPITQKEAVPSIVGGYSKADLTDAKVREAAALGLNGLQTIAIGQSNWEIVIAEVQVVAGLNYRFRARNAASGKSAEIVVYRDLQDQLTLTSVSSLD